MTAAHRDGRSLLVVSPHLDDAVLSCGQLLSQCAGATVLTIFAGVPPAAPDRTAWDAACGFSSSRQAVLSRRGEDAEALRRLGARPLWLDFLDSQYGDTPSADAVAGALSEVVHGMQPATVLMPLGLYHSDHELAHEACLLARRRTHGPQWIAYEDAMYRRCGGALQQRLAQLLAQGVVATPIAPDGLWSAALGRAGSPWSAATKHEAIRCYTSQLRAFGVGALTDTELPESFWDLADQKPGTREEPEGYETTVRSPCGEQLTEDIGKLIELHRAYVATGMGIVAAHELSQPLSAIANYAEAGLRRLEQEHVTLEDLAEDLRKIKVQTRRAAELMRHLRSLVDRNTGPVRPEDLNELVRSACDSFSRATRYRHIQVVLQLAEDLPLVIAERFRTQHAIANLLQNASDAILVSGRTAGLITVMTARAVNETGCSGCMTMRDNGIGIMPDSAARFFEPFFTTKAGGLGMGLTVSRALIQAQGGRLWLEPAEEAGIVHFTLPFAS